MKKLCVGICILSRRVVIVPFFPAHTPRLTSKPASKVLEISPLTTANRRWWLPAPTTRREKQQVVARWSLRLVTAKHFFKFIKPPNGWRWREIMVSPFSCPVLGQCLVYCVAHKRRRLEHNFIIYLPFFFLPHFDKNSYKYLKEIVCWVPECFSLDHRTSRAAKRRAITKQLKSSRKREVEVTKLFFWTFHSTPHTAQTHTQQSS